MISNIVRRNTKCCLKAKKPKKKKKKIEPITIS